MAKSLRSKWRRKCRAVKRERYGVKELAQLKKTLGVDESSATDADMNEISEIATVTSAKAIKEEAVKKEGKDGEQKMDEDGARVFNKKTMRDQHGNYPVWMSKRKIGKARQGRSKVKKNSKKEIKGTPKQQKKSRNKAKN